MILLKPLSKLPAHFRKHSCAQSSLSRKLGRDASYLVRCLAQAQRFAVRHPAQSRPSSPEMFPYFIRIRKTRPDATPESAFCRRATPACPTNSCTILRKKYKLPIEQERGERIDPAESSRYSKFLGGTDGKASGGLVRGSVLCCYRLWWETGGTNGNPPGRGRPQESSGIDTRIHRGRPTSLWCDGLHSLPRQGRKWERSGSRETST